MEMAVSWRWELVLCALRFSGKWEVPLNYSTELSQNRSQNYHLGRARVAPGGWTRNGDIGFPRGGGTPLSPPLKKGGARGVLIPGHPPGATSARPFL